MSIENMFISASDIYPNGQVSSHDYEHHTIDFQLCPPEKDDETRSPVLFMTITANEHFEDGTNVELSALFSISEFERFIKEAKEVLSALKATKG